MSVCRHCHHRLRLCRCGTAGTEAGEPVWRLPLPDVTHCGPYPDGERWRRHEPEP